MYAKSTRIGPWRSVLLTILGTPLACMFTYLIGSFLGELAAKSEKLHTPSPATPAGLFIDPAELSLGEVWEDPEFVATLRLQNTSDQEISVTKFVTSCDCSGIEPPSPIVPAHSVVPLRAKINLTHRPPWAWGLEKRSFSLSIHPVVKSGWAPNGWNITALVTSRVSLSALQLEFADRCTHAGPLIPRKAQATAYVPLAALEAAAEPRSATVHVAPLPASPGKYEITIAPDPNLPLGPFRFDVHVTAVTPEGVRYRCATIQVSGKMQPSTRIVPDIVLLGEHPVGSEATAEVSVRFPRGSGWAVDRVVAESKHLKLAPNGSLPDGTLRYRLTQTIAQRGDQESKATFIVAKGQGTWETVELIVRYHGVTSRGE